MNRKISFFILMCLIITTLAGCNAKAENSIGKTAQNIVEQEEKLNNTRENEELLEKILVTYEVDSLAENGEQRMQVDIKNTSDKIFTGNIYIDFLDKEGENITEGGNIIGDSIVTVKELNPGNTTLCNVNVKSIPEENIYMNYSFADESNFTDDRITDGKLNEELSDKISESAKDSFGNEYFTADWYPSITNIEVYTTDDKDYIVATVTADGEKIGNMLFGNFAYGEDAKISKIIVKDEVGNVVFTKSK